MRGIINYFNDEKAYGFIDSEEKVRHFFHINDFTEFTKKKNPKKFRGRI